MAELEMKNTHMHPGKSTTRAGSRPAEITDPSNVQIPAASGSSNRNNPRIPLIRFMMVWYFLKKWGPKLLRSYMV
jgi:hypothetical protein